jgi:hypothetical protein
MSRRKRASDFKMLVGSTRRAYFLTERMKKLVDKTSNARGKNTEKLFARALMALKEEGKIASFYMTPKWSRADKQGIDAVIFLLDGSEVKLQIKSSWKGVVEHEEKQKNFKESIPVVYGNYLRGESFEEYKERIFKALSE